MFNGLYNPTKETKWNAHLNNVFDNSFYGPMQSNDVANIQPGHLNIYQAKTKLMYSGNKLIENLNGTPIKYINRGNGNGDNNGNQVNANVESNNLLTSCPKEKTPLCLLNELARYNKITSRYDLVNEEGPAHRKVFHVHLKFGTEEFTSSGQSIKKARHAVALEALKTTKYPFPPSKAMRQHLAKAKNSNPSLTPSVELNAIAMKRGEVAKYEVIGGFKGRLLMDKFDFKGSPFKRVAFEVEVTVASKTFRGSGLSLKMARHDAASKAIEELKREGLAVKKSPNKGNEDQLIALTAAAPEVGGDGPVELSSVDVNKTTTNEPKKSIYKSEISQVYEIAFKRNFTVNFEVIKESGPPHMKMYKMRCTCGDIMVEEEGISKKVSKKRSAVKMLEELNKLSPLPASANANDDKSNNKKFYNKYKANKNAKTVKIQKPNPDRASNINPVSRLLQILQAKRQPEPQFAISETGQGRNREFQVQITVGSQQTSASARSKKLAKKIASENMLALLGFCNPLTTSQSKSGDNLSSMDTENNSIITPLGTNNGQSVTFGNTAETNSLSATDSGNFCPIQQLQYLGRTYGFRVQFRDIPKTIDATHNVVSLVTLTTNPPQHSHGEGRTVEESQKKAAMNAIKQLSELGLNGLGNGNTMSREGICS